jgi:hypothetical protein
VKDHTSYTTSADLTRLWDPATGQAFGDSLALQAAGDSLTGEGLGNTDVAFSPNGQLLASTSADGPVRLSATPTWVSHACERGGKNFAQTEWERYTNDAQCVRYCEQYPAGIGAVPCRTNLRCHRQPWESSPEVVPRVVEVEVAVPRSMPAGW